MIGLRLTPWELNRIIDKMEEGAQEDCDRELMLKLWGKRRQLRGKSKKVSK